MRALDAGAAGHRRDSSWYKFSKVHILKSFSSVVALHREYARKLAFENVVQVFKSHSRIVALHSIYARALTFENLYLHAA